MTPANEITSTAELAETEWDGHSEPQDVPTDMVATDGPSGRGIEFHVSMRDYTQRDMEDLIVAAAAQMIVGRHNDRAMAKAIEAKALEMINARATEALGKVTSEIIDQPLTPNFAGGKPVTMREFLSLYGREFLTQRVDRDGKPVQGNGWSSYSQTRIEQLAQRYLDSKFKSEIEKATNAAVAEIRKAVEAHHAAFLDAEKARFRAALAKLEGK